MNLKDRILASNRSTKKLIAAITDFLSISFSIFISLFILGHDLSSIDFNQLLRILFVPTSSVLIFYLFGIYSSILRYIDFAFIYLLLKAMFTVVLLNILASFVYAELILPFLNISYGSLFSFQEWVVGFLSSIFIIFISRITANNILSSHKFEKRVVIYGAGSAGMQLAGALRVSKEMQPIAFIDKNRNLQNSYIGGLKVLHPKKLEKLASKGKVDEVLIAMPSASKSNLKNLLREIEKFSIKVRILPGLAALAQGKVSVSELKEVDTADLLGRMEVEANQELLNRNIENKVVLITGAGGSIGSEISRQVIKNKPSKIILLDSNEYALFSIKNEIANYSSEVNLYTILANVTNKDRIKEVFTSFKVNTVYHAAAYKHVPLVEENPFEAVSNNIIGTKICAESALESAVETFVLISTDKAVRPTNIMGATKRFSELILQSMVEDKKTKMTMVRFGNVIGSSGSAVPLFQQQIKMGGPITVTHPEIIRYFMSIPEAAELVIQAGAMGEGGDVFVLDMGEPVKIIEIAKRLINLSGMELIDDKNPEGDIEIKFTGLRPGEKLYEELLIGNNVSLTEHKRIFKAQEDSLSREQLSEYLYMIKEAQKSGDTLALKEILKMAVPGFTPETDIVDVVYNQKNI